MKQTSITCSPLSPPSMDFATPLTAKTPTKYTPSEGAEEMLTRMFAEIVSITLHIFSKSSVPIERRQLCGTNIANDTIQIDPFLASWKLVRVSISRTQRTYQQITWINSTLILGPCMENLRSEAVVGGSLRKFAVGNATVTNFQTIYALVQCTPDLSKQDCKNCLDGASKEISKCCYGK
jgi:hypothetical protein